MVDLHIHTTASDGRLNIEEVIVCAKNNGVKTIAITDHDTVDGLKNYSFLNYRNNDVIVIPGIEFSTEEINSLHILGYNIDINNRKLNNALKQLEISYAIAIKKLCSNVNACYNSDISPFYNGRALMKKRIADLYIKNNVFSTYYEAYSALDYNKYNIKQPKRLPAKQVIDLIKQANGIAVLAHPGRLLEIYSEKELVLLMNELVQMGIQGIECFNPTHNMRQEEILIEYAISNNIIISAGSDFHGEKGERIGRFSRYDLYRKYENMLLYNS